MITNNLLSVLLECVWAKGSSDNGSCLMHFHIFKCFHIICGDTIFPASYVPMFRCTKFTHINFSTSHSNRWSAALHIMRFTTTYIFFFTCFPFRIWRRHLRILTYFLGICTSGLPHVLQLSHFHILRCRLRFRPEALEGPYWARRAQQRPQSRL